MRVRDWRSPHDGTDLGARHGDPIGIGGRGGVMATEGNPPKVPTGMGHTHGQWDKHREREAAKRAAAKAAAV